MMHFDLTRPCDDCPFRSDRLFHLHPDRIRDILGAKSERKWWPAASFPCHKTVDYSHDDRGRVGPKAQQCAGVMIILTREGRPNDAMQLAERFGLWQPTKLDMSAPVYENTQAAIEAMKRSTA